MDPELVVRFSGDTKDFDSAIDGMKRKLGELDPAVNKTSDSFTSFAKGYLSIAAVMGASRVFLDSTKAVQKFENQLKVASGTQQDYAKNTQFLEGLAAKYNKNVIDLGANFAQLTIATRGTNLEGAKTERLFAAVTATSAALQMSVDDTNGTFRAFIQMVSKGNVQAEELRGQLGERLYGAFNLAAKAMGVTTQELNKMLEQGEVLAEDLLPKLTVELENTFGDTAQQNAKNLGSTIEFAAGQFSLLIAEAGKTSGFTDFLTQAASDAGSLLSQLRLLNKEKGFLAAAGGLAGSALETLLSGTGYSSEALNYARNQQSNHGYDPLIGSSLRLPGEIQPTSRSQFPFAQNFSPTPTNTSNPAAEEKARKAAEVAARKAQREIDKWVSEEIRKSKDRIAEGLLDAEIANDAAFRKYNTGVDTPSMRGSTGLTNNYSYQRGEINKTGVSFTNATTGDGTTNYDHIIAGMDDAIEQIKERYSKIQHSTDEFSQHLADSIGSGLGVFVVGISETMGQLIGNLATGAGSMADIGNAFMGVVAGLFENIGQALASYAATLLVAKIAMGSMNIAAAAAGAVLAFGAAAVLKSQMQSASEQAFYSGGIVQGRGGVDNVHTALSPGEMVLNGGQQGRLWNMITGANTGREFAGMRGSGGLQVSHVTVHGRIRSGDIDISGKQGERKNKYFRGN